MRFGVCAVVVLSGCIADIPGFVANNTAETSSAIADGMGAATSTLVRGLDENGRGPGTGDTHGEAYVEGLVVDDQTVCAVDGRIEVVDAIDTATARMIACGRRSSPACHCAADPDFVCRHGDDVELLDASSRTVAMTRACEGRSGPCDCLPRAEALAAR